MWENVAKEEAKQETEREKARQRGRVAEAVIAKCASVEEAQEVAEKYRI